MLEFIVLGQVPGTSIYLSFHSVLIMWATFLASIVFYKVIIRALPTGKKQLKKIEEIAI